MSEGGDFSWLKLIFAFAVVAGMLAGLGFILKYIGTRGFALPGRAAKPRRMRIVETLPIDTRRRMLIISCDGREHLLLLSAERDIVVEKNLSPTPSAETP